MKDNPDSAPPPAQAQSAHDLGALFNALQRTETALRAGDERMRRLLALSPVVIYAIRWEAGAPRPDHISANVERVLGYTPAEVVTPGFWHDHVHPDDVARVESMFARVVADGRTSAEYRLRRRDGAYLWIDDEMWLERDAAGAPAQVVGSWRDVTERRAAAEALRASEERFRALIERATDLLFVVDREGIARFVSDATAASLGYVASDLVGRPVVSIVHPDDVHFLRENAAAVRASGGSRRFTCRVFAASGEVRTLECVSRSLLDVPAVAAVVVNARDVTEQLRLQAQVTEAQKLESLGRLAGGVAHDFNNLLTVVMSCVEFLGHEVRGQERAMEDVRQIRGAALRARELTAQLLAVARRRVMAPRAVDLNEMVRSAEKLLRRALGEDIALRSVLAEGLWSARVDPTGLEQVVLNLALNARDAMPDGGSLTLETANVRAADVAPGTLPDVSAGEYVRLSVRDTGVGMTPEVRAHVFEPFFTTKPTGQGTGLGLATVHGIVTQSGGAVRVVSEPGEGTTFEVYLPRTSEAPPDAEEGEVRAAQPGRETVLVVEDEPAVRALTSRAVASAGYRVLVAHDGEHALSLAAAEAGAIDLLLTDVVMPGMSGVQLAARLTALRPSMRVLFVSGYTEDVIEHRGLLMPGVEFLAKPLMPSTLLPKVRAVLGPAR